MQPMTVRIVDPRGNLVATAEVVQEGSLYTGRVDVSRMPESVRQLFEEFNSIVNDQIFSLLDAIEERIAALGLRVRFDEGPEVMAENLQVFPAGETLSFSVGRPASVPG